MLILMLAISALIFLLIGILKKSDRSFSLLLLSAAETIMFGGIIIYIAMMGGTAAKEVRLLFVSSDIQHWLRALPIHLDRLGYIVAVCRLLFPWLYLRVSLEFCNTAIIRRRARLVRMLTFLPTALFLVYYYPPVFRWFAELHFEMQVVMMKLVFAWILLVMTASFALLILEYARTTIPMFRRDFFYILLYLSAAAVLYLLYATKDPSQIYNMFISEYIQLGISNYISSALSSRGWSVIFIITLLSTAAGTYGVFRYVQVEYSENREDLRLERQFDLAGMGVSVFAHGMKNQVLAAQVLHKRMKKELARDEPDIEQLRRFEEQLSDLNVTMKTRLEEFYSAVRNNALTLVPVPVQQIAELAGERFHEKYPVGQLQLQICTRRKVLADKTAVTEAVYNLLINGYEAAAAAGRTPQVRLSVRAERMWTVFEVKDNGNGIPPSLRGKIFEPFYTSKSKNTNWGMGLFYVRRIVRKHFGHLKAVSEEGKGSTFLLMLPRYGDEEGGKHHSSRQEAKS